MWEIAAVHGFEDGPRAPTSSQYVQLRRRDILGWPTDAGACLGDRRYHLRPIAEFVLVSLYTETGALRIVLSVTPAPVRLERGIL